MKLGQAIHVPEGIERNTEMVGNTSVVYLGAIRQ
jgi:hypothetical protein